MKLSPCEDRRQDRLPGSKQLHRIPFAQVRFCGDSLVERLYYCAIARGAREQLVRLCRLRPGVRYTDYPLSFGVRQKAKIAA
jgi:hypothetical protein